MCIYSHFSVLTLHFSWENHYLELKWNCENRNLLIPWEVQERDLSESDLKRGLTRSSTATAAKALILEDTVLKGKIKLLTYNTLTLIIL